MTLRPGSCLTIILLLYLCSGQSDCLAQDKSGIEFGKVTPADFILPSSSIIDSNASAVILSDVGTIHFVGNKSRWFSYVYQRQTRIKILNKKAFDEAAILRVFLYKPTRNPEDIDKLDKLSGSTYNLENGQVVQTQLETKDVFQDRNNYNKEFVEERFTLPAVKEGSIIEYTYTITSPYNFNLPSWQFQSEKFPCRWSELQVDIPQALFYVIVRQGVHGYAIDKGSEGSENYRLVNEDGGPGDIINATTVKHRWVMKDIPAFHEEEFLPCPGDYLDKIEFQLAKTYNGEEYADHMNSWKKANEQLLEKDNFGEHLDDHSDAITNLVTRAIGDSSTALGQAKALYYYICRHFTCNDYNDNYIKTSLYDVMKKNSGTVGDINLLLVAAMRKIGIQADPVVLSTRDHGFNLASYPVLQRLNYVIARVKINGTVYYLDAARPGLGFGQLHGSCYNGHARIISKTDSGSVYFEADSLREKKTTVVFITETDKKSEGSWQSTLGQQGSYELRRQVTEKGAAEYFKDIQTRFGEDISISNGGIDSLDRPEDPVSVHYDFSLHLSDGEAKVYVNPFIGEALHENPFKAADRQYPVQMPFCRDELYIFTMQVPEGYGVEELPKSARALLNGDQGSFEYLIADQGGMIQLRCRLKLNKANFTRDDYSSLRDFFALVVSKEGESIVLKKQ